MTRTSFKPLVCRCDRLPMGSMKFVFYLRRSYSRRNPSDTPWTAAALGHWPRLVEKGGLFAPRQGNKLSHSCFLSACCRAHQQTPRTAASIVSLLLLQHHRTEYSWCYFSSAMPTHPLHATCWFISLWLHSSEAHGCFN